MPSTSSQPVHAFEPYSNDVYGWAYRLVGRHHDALDVVQDVFLKWREQCATHVPEQPRGWLRRVTLNRAIDIVRSRAKTAPDTAITPAAERPPTLDTADQAALRNDISMALEGLSDMQRGVLVAKIYDGMTFTKIAAEFGLAVSTAKTHYLRAVSTVRNQLQPRWGQEDAT